jgi:hypothetical protein
VPGELVLLLQEANLGFEVEVLRGTEGGVHSIVQGNGNGERSRSCISSAPVGRNSDRPDWGWVRGTMSLRKESSDLRVTGSMTKRFKVKKVEG